MQSTKQATLLFAMVLVALNLRPALTSVAPLLERMVSDLSLSRTMAGLVTSIPVLLMGLLAPLAPILARRWSQETVLAGTLVLLIVALLLRGFSEYGAFWLLLSAAGVGTSIAIAGPLIAGFIKQYLKLNMGLALGLFSVSITAGAALAVACMLPLTRLFDGHWGPALASWAILAALALLVWCRVVPMSAPATAEDIRVETMPLRSTRAWLLTALFACQSGVFYALSTWLVARYEHAGFSLSLASDFTSVFMTTGIVGAFLTPFIASRIKDRRWLLLPISGSTSLLILLIAWQPGWHPWLVNTALGITTAGFFALILALPVMEASNPRKTASLTAMMLSAGYLLGGTVPSLVGFGRDISHGFEWPMTLLAGLCFIMLLISLSLTALPDKTES